MMAAQQADFGAVPSEDGDDALLREVLQRHALPSPGPCSGSDVAPAVGVTLDDHREALRELNAKWIQFANRAQSDADEAVRRAMIVATESEEKFFDNDKELNEQRLKYEERFERLIAKHIEDVEDLRDGLTRQKEEEMERVRREAEAELASLRDAGGRERREYRLAEEGRRSDAVARHGSEMRALRESSRSERRGYEEKLEAAAAEGEDLAARGAAEMRSLGVARDVIEREYGEKLEASAAERVELEARHAAEVRSMRDAKDDEIGSYEVKLETARVERGDMAAMHATEMDTIRATAARDVREYEEKSEAVGLVRAEMVSKHASEMDSLLREMQEERRAYEQRLEAASVERMEMVEKHVEGMASLREKAESEKRDYENSWKVADAERTEPMKPSTLVKKVVFRERLERVEAFYQQKIDAAKEHPLDTEHSQFVARQCSEMDSFLSMVKKEGQEYANQWEAELADLVSKHSVELAGLSDKMESERFSNIIT